MKKVLYISLFFLIILISCRTGKVTNTDISYLYERDMISFIPGHTVYHLNDSISRIFYRFNSGNLLYVKEIKENNFSAKYSIHTELYETNDMKVIRDSSTFIFSDNEKEIKKNITGSIDVKAVSGKNYLVKFSFNDLNKNTSVDIFIDINKSDPNSAQNFLLLDSDSLPAFTNTPDTVSEYKLLCNNKNIQKLFVGYYDRIFPIAAPPFSFPVQKTFQYAPDSLYSIPVTNGITPALKFLYKGFYNYRSDTSQTEGFTIFRFYDGYPKITTAEQMLLSLRYLTGKNEYDDLVLKKNKKEAVEDFWLELAGNPERAKEMIKSYYNRVQDANRLFTSYLEGWKTDRGIIYIVYGIPNIVYKNKDIETWTYGEDRNMLSISFNFTKVTNPFTDNDYSLSRSPAYKDGWYLAVDNWRR